MIAPFSLHYTPCFRRMHNASTSAPPTPQERSPEPPLDTMNHATIILSRPISSSAHLPARPVRPVLPVQSALSNLNRLRGHAHHPRVSADLEDARRRPRSRPHSRVHHPRSARPAITGPPIPRVPRCADRRSPRYAMPSSHINQRTAPLVRTRKLAITLHHVSGKTAPARRVLAFP